MTRRKGERPLSVTLDSWSPAHPVARIIATGSFWFDAWIMQKSIPYARLSALTGIPARRIDTIAQGDRIPQAELDALARAWCISAADLRASIAGAVDVIP